MRNFILGLAVILLVALPLAGTIFLANCAVTSSALWLRILTWIGAFCAGAVTYGFISAIGEIAVFYSENHKKEKKNNEMSNL